MGAIHKIGVAASLLLMVHATLCAIQRAPLRRLPSSPSLLTSDAPRRRSGLSEVDSRVIHDATRRGALRSRPACVPAHSDKRWSSLPQIVIQCLLATLGGIWGVLGLKGGMVPIRTTEALSKQTMDALLPGMDFMHFNTRELR